jgi:hypothetical protein
MSQSSTWFHGPPQIDQGCPSTERPEGDAHPVGRVGVLSRGFPWALPEARAHERLGNPPSSPDGCSDGCAPRGRPRSPTPARTHLMTTVGWLGRRCGRPGPRELTRDDPADAGRVALGRVEARGTFGQLGQVRFQTLQLRRPTDPLARGIGGGPGWPRRGLGRRPAAPDSRHRPGLGSCVAPGAEAFIRDGPKRGLLHHAHADGWCRPAGWLDGPHGAGRSGTRAGLDLRPQRVVTVTTPSIERSRPPGRPPAARRAAMGRVTGFGRLSSVAVGLRALETGSPYARARDAARVAP